MHNAKFIAPELKNWINTTYLQYEDAATNLSFGIGLDELQPNLANTYMKFTKDKAIYDKAIEDFDSSMKQGVDIFLEGWPLLEYIKHIQYLCSYNSIVVQIELLANKEQIQRINQTLFSLNNNIIKQEVIIKIFLEQQYLTNFMVQNWNELQNNILKSSVSFLEVISEIYLQKSTINIRSILMSPVSAYKWFKFLFSDDSHLKTNTPENKKRRDIVNKFCNFMLFASAFLAVSSVLFIFLGKKNNREIYIIMMLISIITLLGIYYYKHNNHDKSQVQQRDAEFWLSSTVPGDPYQPNLSYEENLEFSLEYPMP